MKAKLQAKITEVVKDATYCNNGVVNTNMVKLTIIAPRGKVNTTMHSAQLASLDGNLWLREAIASQMKIGATITITISDEDPDEGAV